MRKKPPVGPKLTWKELEERTDITAADGRKYHAELPASWDNAEWVSKHPECHPDFPDGHRQNEKLKSEIMKAFVDCKEIDLTDPNGSPWLLAWRMYPNRDHPVWKREPQGCGCNCGCLAPRNWPAARPANITAVAGSMVKKPEVGPKLTWKELEERTDLSAADGRKYHAELPASWDNAEWVAKHPESDPDFPEGQAQNTCLKQAMVAAFLECKQIDTSDPDGSPWLLAWRMYPNKDHPIWQKEPHGCGCNCGCLAPRNWSPPSSQ
jgi:hypothetical protein